ncbi:MAG: DedA family protein [Patescibacteria group bacterium]
MIDFYFNLRLSKTKNYCIIKHMAYLHQIITYFGYLAVTLTSFLGYPGIFILMTMESMIIPLPSELVMPFAGFLVTTGRFNFWLVIIASSLGSLCGSLISYWIGYWGGEKLVRKFGRYVFLDEQDLTKAERWFYRRGEITIFVARFVPVVRHLISIPAGVGKMNLKKFCVYTIIGATIWNSFLAYAGLIAGKNWGILRKYSEIISLPITIIIIVVLIVMVLRHIRNHKIKTDG